MVASCASPTAPRAVFATGCDRPPPPRARLDNEDKIAANNLISRLGARRNRAVVGRPAGKVSIVDRLLPEPDHTDPAIRGGLWLENDFKLR